MGLATEMRPEGRTHAPSRRTIDPLEAARALVRAGVAIALVTPRLRSGTRANLPIRGQPLGPATPPITSNAPELAPKLRSGMPAYSLGGKNVGFFPNAHMFEARYAMLGFDKTGLDDGNRWATSAALKDFTPAVKKRIPEPVKVVGGDARRRSQGA